jgi:2-polyprenyl-3-methyl-5-hydroxy-6-metoxy-1,4-benzoquinol methylase
MNIAMETIQFHVNMLNDKARTSSYLASIRKVVRPGDTVVDIGTGTGIFAVAAARAGARHVYAIEAGPIARAATRLFEANGLAARITLIRGLSTRIWLPERADVLISEVIGDEPLAEGVIGITKDALRRLLKPGARLIPSRIRIFGLPVTIPGAELGKLTFTRGTLQNWRSWYDIQFAPLTRIAENLPFESHFSYFINPYTMRDWKILSAPVLLADVDFKRWRGPWIHTSKTVTATESGHLDGLMVYFELQVGSSTFLSTHPRVVDENNHWHSPVRIFTKPIALQQGDRFDMTYWYRRVRGVSGCEVCLSN